MNIVLQKALVPRAELLGTETPSEMTNVAMTTPVASAVLEVATRRLVRVNTVTLPCKERHGEVLRVALCWSHPSGADTVCLTGCPHECQRCRSQSSPRTTRSRECSRSSWRSPVGGRHLDGALIGVLAEAKQNMYEWYARGSMPTIRVVLAEDNALLREGISHMIDVEEELDLVGVAADLPELLALVVEHEPDVVVTDIRMPPTGTDEGIQAASWIRENRPTMGVVVLSQYTAPAYALALLEDGSAGRAYLLKERVAGAHELSRTIRVVASGGSVIDPNVVDELVRARAKHPKSDLEWLTPRESEILAEMAQGKSNGAIAKSLSVSERAVEKHSNAIFSKLGLSEERDLNRRVKAVLVYLGAQPGG